MLSLPRNDHPVSVDKVKAAIYLRSGHEHKQV